MRSSIVGCSTTQVRIVCAKRRIDIGALQDHPNFPLPLPGANALNLASLISLDSTVSQILVASCVSDRDLTVLDLTRFSQLRRLVIGDNCFTKATMLLVQDMECLERVAIGDYSFTEYEGVFYAVACPCLTELTIGASSFVHYQQCVIESTRRGGCEE